METSLHRQLKAIYAERDGKTEVALDRFRIDVVAGEELIEIQHGSLAAIRDKIRELLKKHRVRVVKPLVALKHLVKRTRPEGPVVSRRLSPKRATIFSLFDELMYFTRVFPHRNLTLEVPLVEIEELRYPGHGRRRRRRDADFLVEDQKLLDIQQVYEFRRCGDLLKLIPGTLPSPFHTGHLATNLNVDRHIAQRVAYCLRETGATIQVGKAGNAILYDRANSKAA